MSEMKIVRANGAGVFFGKVVEENGDVVVMENARRLWYWEGASSLSELAQYGTAKPDNCKFPCAVDRIKIFNVLEILDCTDEAVESINGVKEWKQR